MDKQTDERSGCLSCISLFFFLTPASAALIYWIAPASVGSWFSFRLSRDALLADAGVIVGFVVCVAIVAFVKSRGKEAETSVPASSASQAGPENDQGGVKAATADSTKTANRRPKRKRQR